MPPPDPAAPAGEHGFTFDRSGYRVPAIIVSPWVAEGEVLNEEHRHTSLIATLREQWDLGDPFTARDAAARTFSHAFTLDTPPDPHTWPVPDPRPVPQFILDAVALGQAVSALGKTLLDGIRGYAAQNNIEIEGLPADPQARHTPRTGAAHHLDMILAVAVAAGGASYEEREDEQATRRVQQLAVPLACH